MAVTISLWIDQLMNSGIGDFASFLTLYKVASFVTLAVSDYVIMYMTDNFISNPQLLLPWFITVSTVAADLLPC